jgi:hypothetical protein
MSLTYPHRKKSIGVISGERGVHGNPDNNLESHYTTQKIDDTKSARRQDGGMVMIKLFVTQFNLVNKYKIFGGTCSPYLHSSTLELEAATSSEI